MALEIQINFRVSETEYKTIEEYKKLRNQHSTKKIGYRDIFMEKINDDMSNSNVGLTIKRNELLNKYDELKTMKNGIVSDMEEIEIQLSKLDTVLNNSTLYDLSNYRHNNNIVKAVDSVKEYCINNSILKPDYIPNEVLRELEITFKITENNLLKNIVYTEFDNWEEEINTNTSENTKEKKLKKVGLKIMGNFRNSKQPIKDLNEYIEANKECITRKTPTGYTFKDMKEYLLNMEY